MRTGKAEGKAYENIKEQGIIGRDNSKCRVSETEASSKGRGTWLARGQ